VAGSPKRVGEQPPALCAACSDDVALRAQPVEFEAPVQVALPFVVAHLVKVDVHHFGTS
jgi:hypothetical protein